MAISLPQQIAPSSRSRRSISIWEVVSMAIEAMWSNKLRTALTMLGVIIGIASVIAITSVGQGVQKATEQQIQALGTDLLQVFPGAAKTGGISQGVGSGSTLTWEDAKAIQQNAPAVQIVSAYMQKPGQIVYQTDNHSANLVGIDTNYAEARDTKVTQGRFFTQEEEDNAVPVAILGSAVYDKLFDDDQTAVGEQIRIQGEGYQVVGVFESKGTEGSIDRDDQVFIPLKVMLARVVGNHALTGRVVNGLYVKAKSQDQMKAAEFQVTNLLRLRHNLSNTMSDDFSIRNQEDTVKTYTNVVSLFTVMVVAIASISLLVGGIGIANIMLVSVVERTREIGIRKAVGATDSAILNQFLTESVAIAIAGGGIGISIGIFIAFMTSLLLKIPFIISIWSIICGVALSFVVGLLAGVIPARNASQLDPIAALRSE